MSPAGAASGPIGWLGEDLRRVFAVTSRGAPTPRADSAAVGRVRPWVEDGAYCGQPQGVVSSQRCRLVRAKVSFIELRGGGVSFLCRADPLRHPVNTYPTLCYRVLPTSLEGIAIAAKLGLFSTVGSSRRWNRPRCRPCFSSPPCMSPARHELSASQRHRSPKSRDAADHARP